MLLLAMGVALVSSTSDITVHGFTYEEVHKAVALICHECRIRQVPTHYTVEGPDKAKLERVLKYLSESQRYGR